MDSRHKGYATRGGSISGRKLIPHDPYFEVVVGRPSPRLDVGFNPNLWAHNLGNGGVPPSEVFSDDAEFGVARVR